MKQAIKKKSGATITRKSINDIKASLGMALKKDNYSLSCAEKEMEFIPMPEAFVEATKLPGIPMGYMSIVTGWSNTGKSTLKNCLIASCMNNGILPVIYETESNFDFSYAIDCGMKATPIYGDVDVEHVDEETGEITYTTERKIVDYEGDFLYFDGETLCEMYGDNDYLHGKKTAKKRNVPVLEDIAYSMNDLLDKQAEGIIQQPICFIWDSVGSIISYKSYESKVGNNMFDANAIGTAFNSLLNNRIPLSRKISSPYSNTCFFVNKIWNDSMNSMGGVPSIKLKGGEFFNYAVRLWFHLGGVGKASIKKLSATAKGETYNYGITTKIRVQKNQLPSPHNITYEGEMCCVHNGICTVDGLDAYKKTFGKELLKKLEEAHSNHINATVDDINFVEEEIEVDQS